MTRKKLWFTLRLYGFPRDYDADEMVRTRRRILLGDLNESLLVVGMGWEFGEFVITLKER